jgi:GTPase SAR1 family protein
MCLTFCFSQGCSSNLHPDIFFFSSRLLKFESKGKQLDKTEYAKYLLTSYEEWSERYTPLLAEHREIDTYVARIGSGKRRSRQIPVAKIPEVSRVSVLLGESGSGKTTALWSLITERSQRILTAKTTQLPILISLREWSITHNCRSLVQEQFELLEVGEEGVEHELREGNCLVLIDGLNELSPGESFRTKAYQDLQRFLTKYQDNVFVMCCRATDYESGMLYEEGLRGKVKEVKAYEIRRMGRDQMVDYVKKYFRKDSQSAEDLLSKLEIYDEDLWDDQRSIVHLARIPLYLQLFILEYERSKKLPNNQARLLKALIDRTLDREKGKHAARVDSLAKEQLLSGFAFEAVLKGHWLRLADYLAQEIFKNQLQKLKTEGFVEPGLTVGAAWQEIVSNNFLKVVSRRWTEWLHQLICDYFLGCEIVRVWTLRADIEKETLAATLTTTAWAQACGIALGLLQQDDGAGFLETLTRIHPRLAQLAFEAQVEEDQRELSNALLSAVIETRDIHTERLDNIAVNLPSAVVIEAFIQRFKVCGKEWDAPIAKAVSELLIAHSVPTMQYRLNAGDGSYDSQSQYFKRLSSTVTRATDLLKAWTNNKNELVTFYAAKGLWGYEPNLTAQTLKRLTRSKSPEVVTLVRSLMDEWGIE